MRIFAPCRAGTHAVSVVAACRRCRTRRCGSGSLKSDYLRSKMLSHGACDARQFTFRICFCVRPISSTRKALVLTGLRFATTVKDLTPGLHVLPATFTIEILSRPRNVQICSDCWAPQGCIGLRPPSLRALHSETIPETQVASL